MTTTRRSRLLALGLAILIARSESLLKAQTPAEPRFENEIRAFEEQDRKSPPPQDAVLFIGSSTIRLWKTVEQDFPGTPVINRGFGGSEIVDSTRNAGRIVVPYHPRLIVFYAGTNDIANGKSPRQVRDDYRAFVARVRQELPDVPIVFLAIKPTPARWSQQDRVSEANRLIAADSRHTPGLFFVDTGRVLVEPDGRPKESLVISDKLHFNAEGYRVWTRYLRPRIERLYERAAEVNRDRPLWNEP